MKVSVIIPTYNRKEELIRAVESVYNQSYQPAEIIVVDDGSKVKADNILNCGLNNNLKIIYQQNKGVSSARNRGLKESQYQWIAFLDSDDWWLPPKLERQIEYHRCHPNIIISQTDEIWIRRGKRVNPKKYHQKKSGDLFSDSLKRCFISPSAVMLHRRLFLKVGFFDETLPVAEDYDLWLRITAQYEVGLIKEKLVAKTGGHPDQLSQKYWGMDRFRVKALEKILATDLSLSQRKETIKTICHKLKILENGCRKRGRIAEANNNLEKYEYYRSL